MLRHYIFREWLQILEVKYIDIDQQKTGGEILEIGKNFT